ncbi:hypothetical protein GGD61_007652 [Bradyrhizobium sp. SBR1B]|nr:hypothetical protein [Bradyrhizobium sp. SBR1B]
MPKARSSLFYLQTIDEPNGPSIFLKVSRGVSLTCLCIVVIAVVVVPLELLFYPFLKSIGCSLSDGQQGFTCDGWIGGFTSSVLNLPILFSDAREFTFGP